MGNDLEYVNLIKEVVGYMDSGLIVLYMERVLAGEFFFFFLII